MRRLFERPLRTLIVLGVVAAASPFLWAGYHWYAGRTALQRYHSAEARDHLSKCLRVWPWSRSSSTHLLAARAARRDGDFAEAARHLRICQDTLHDNSAETILEWAMLHASAGDLDAVEEYLKEQFRKDPANAPLILEALSEGYLRLYRIADALRCLDEWLTHDPDNVQGLFVRGNVYRQVRSSQEAAKSYRRVVELDPDHEEARWRLAVALLDIGRYREALEHLEVIQKRRPDDDEVKVRLALCRHQVGQGREARAMLDEVIARQPEHGLAVRTRGQLALLDSQLAEAEPWLRQAAQLLPYDYKTQFFLWDCLQKQDKVKEAETQRLSMDKLKDRRQRQSEISTHLMSQKPNDPALQCELGKLSLQLGETESGLNWLRSAVRLDKSYVPALEALADYYQQSGDTEQAEEYRQQAKESSASKVQSAEANKQSPTLK